MQIELHQKREREEKEQAKSNLNKIYTLLSTTGRVTIVCTMRKYFHRETRIQIV